MNWNDRTDRETDLPDYDAFYDHMRSAATLPSTSQPSVGDFLAVYEPLLEAGDDVLSIHLLGQHLRHRRGGPAGARRAGRARIAPERIEVLDSDTGCAGHGLMAIAARNAVRDGADLLGALDAARRLREQMQIIFAVDTLEYLRRGGRIGGAQAWIGSALKIKPILSINREIQPIERTAGRAFERMVEHHAACTRRRVFFSRTSRRPTSPGDWPSAGARSTAAAGVRVRDRPRDRGARRPRPVRRHGAAWLGSGPGLITDGA